MRPVRGSFPSPFSTRQKRHLGPAGLAQQQEHAPCRDGRPDPTGAWCARVGCRPPLEAQRRARTSSSCNSYLSVRLSSRSASALFASPKCRVTKPRLPRISALRLCCPCLRAAPDLPRKTHWPPGSRPGTARVRRSCSARWRSRPCRPASGTGSRRSALPRGRTLLSLVTKPRQLRASAVPNASPTLRHSPRPSSNSDVEQQRGGASLFGRFWVKHVSPPEKQIELLRLAGVLVEQKS